MAANEIEKDHLEDESDRDRDVGPAPTAEEWNGVTFLRGVKMRIVHAQFLQGRLGPDDQDHVFIVRMHWQFGIESNQTAALSLCHLDEIGIVHLLMAERAMEDRGPGSLG